MKIILYTFVFIVLVKNNHISCTEDKETKLSNDEDTRIFGGLSVGISSFPFQAALILNNNYICSAVIISRTWLLTTAKCVANIQEQYLPVNGIITKVFVETVVQVRVGTRDRFGDGSDFIVQTRIVHPSYNNNTLDYDIAALKITGSFTYGTSIRSIALPATTLSIPTRLDVTMSGWGLATVADLNTLRYSRYLNAVNMTTITTTACRTAYNVSAITPRMICARSDVAGNDACQGDEGGPVVGTVNANKILVGLISWGKSCGDPTYPRVSTKIQSVRSWIKTTTGV